MKKVLVLLLCLCIVGCGKKAEKKEIKEDKKSNEWIIAKEFETYFPMDASDIFYKATSNENDIIFPIALLGKQVVSGTNYMFLVQVDNEYYVYIIYNNLENEASITSKKKFDLNKYLNQNKQTDSKDLAGGWKIEVPKDEIHNMQLDEKTQKIFEEASSKLKDKKFYPLTILAHQKASGTNYAVIAYGTPANEELKGDNTGAYILTLNEDSKGTSEIVSASYIDVSEYNK